LRDKAAATCLFTPSVRLTTLTLYFLSRSLGARPACVVCGFRRNPFAARQERGAMRARDNFISPAFLIRKAGALLLPRILFPPALISQFDKAAYFMKFDKQRNAEK
jgi:hypothetical protein